MTRRHGYNTASGWLSAMLVALLLSGCSSGSRSPGTQVPPTGPPPPEPPPTSISLERAFPLLSFLQPVAMLQAPGDGGLWFVVEKRGVVRVFEAATASSAPVFLDIVTRVDSAPGEGGLLGLAFDPDFASNGYVYASYTAPTPFRSIISRFEVDPTAGIADPASEVILLEVPQPLTNHNGGNLAFGPDGYLYAGFGDGGGAGDPDGNAQDTGNVLGAILRLDVSGAPPYAIPPDNPFAGQTECLTGSGTADCPEIFAWGFRNPWRFSFDMESGDLWVGDVGQNAWEEVDRVTGGENYGWNEREGAHCYPPGETSCSLNSVDPITEYDHGVGSSVTGGYVYRGDDIPGLNGQYLFGDFVSGRIWRVPATAAQATAPIELADTTLNISAFGQGEDGEVFVIDYGGGLYRIAGP